MIKPKKKISLMKKSVIGISIAAALIVVLAISLAIALNVANTKPFTDPADNSSYYIMRKDRVWSIYQEDKETMLPIDSYYQYFVTNSGTMVELDRETGEVVETFIIDGTVDNEQIGQNFRTLIFPHIEKANLRSVEVHNNYDTYTFIRYNKSTGLQDDSSDFILKGYPHISFNQELFATLYVTAGYTLTLEKLEDPIKDENGEFSEYGLVPEKRMVEVLDEDGEYIMDKETGEYLLEEVDYVPSYYVLTDKSGNKHKVIIGDRLPTAAGYYVQYVDMSGESEVKRDAVYIMNPEVGNSMLVPIEDYITPTLSYPMNSSDYFDVDDFTIMKKDETDGKISFEEVVSFSFIDLADRENTIKEHISYKFNGQVLNDGYFPSTSISDPLRNIYDPAFESVVIFDPSFDDLVEKGFYRYKDGVENPESSDDAEETADYIITFKYGVRNENEEIVETIFEKILFKKVEETGNYYAFTYVSSVTEKNGEEKITPLYTYNMIVEVKGYSLDFLTWNTFNWVNDTLIMTFIGYMEEIKISAPGYNATLNADNSASPSTEDKMDATKLQISATDSDGNKIETFSHLTFEDTSGNTWDITATKVTVTSPSGETLKASGEYTTNILGKQVYVMKDFIAGKDNAYAKVYVDANEITVVDINGNSTKYIRYGSSLYADLYQTLAWATLENSYPMSKEDEEALINDKDKWQLTVTLKDIYGKETEISFYRLTSRKSYVVVNGDGGFYMLSERVEKIVSDTHKFFDMTPIRYDEKN